jgi:hypothetical protein
VLVTEVVLEEVVVVAELLEGPVVVVDDEVKEVNDVVEAVDVALVEDEEIELLEEDVVEEELELVELLVDVDKELEVDDVDVEELVEDVVDDAVEVAEELEDVDEDEIVVLIEDKVDIVDEVAVLETDVVLLDVDGRMVTGLILFWL